MRYTDAILGVETQVATIHGQAALRIPAGTQDGQVLTMRGAGISPGAAGLALSDGVRQIGAGGVSARSPPLHCHRAAAQPGADLAPVLTKAHRHTVSRTRQLEAASSSASEEAPLMPL